MFKTVCGGFQKSVQVFSVSKKGRLTRYARSEACTYVGDVPSKEVQIDTTLPMVIVVITHGNQGTEFFWTTESGQTRLDKSGISAEQAFVEFLQGQQDSINSVKELIRSRFGDLHWFPYAQVGIQLHKEHAQRVFFEEKGERWACSCKPTEAALEWAAGMVWACPDMEFPNWVWELREVWNS